MAQILFEITWHLFSLALAMDFGLGVTPNPIGWFKAHQTRTLRRGTYQQLKTSQVSSSGNWVAVKLRTSI